MLCNHLARPEFHTSVPRLAVPSLPCTGIECSKKFSCVSVHGGNAPPDQGISTSFQEAGARKEDVVGQTPWESPPHT
jgi:hypothetical protein